MGVREMLGLRESRAAAAEQRAFAAESAVEVLRESVADLELALDERGWRSLVEQGDNLLSREGLRKAARINRAQLVVNPLIKRGMAIRCAYIWGGSVEISARSNGADSGTQDVNAAVQDYITDPQNEAAVFGDEAQERLERALGTDGNVFITNFTRPLTGQVQTRTIPFDQIQRIIKDPQDSATPWYYLRVWQETTEVAGAVVTQERQALYPALFYRPASRPRSLLVAGYGAVEVQWDAPVRHVKVNDQEGWDYGVGDIFAAISFSRMYKEFLTDWALLTKSLSQFAWRLTRKGAASKADELRQKVQRAGRATPGNPGTVGATAIQTDDVSFEAVPKTGATIDSESGRPMAAMVAAALGVSVITLLADPGVTGARATAETLDTPQQNEMQQRRTVWQTAYRDLINYAILQAVKAPQGPLQGLVTRDRWADREVLEFRDSTETTLDFDWPALDELPMDLVIKAISEADATGKLPPLIALRLILLALKVKDVDEIVEEWTDAEGKWVDPNADSAAAVAAAAVDAFRRGQDPAVAMGGDPDEEDDPEDDEDQQR